MNRDSLASLASRLRAEADALEALAAAPAQPTEADLLDLHEGAALAKTTPRALREAARRGELPAYGRRPVRVRRGDVLAWATRKPVRVLAKPAAGDLASDVAAVFGA
jgi:hypothetical protein